MTKEEKKQLVKVKVGAVILLGIGVIDKPTFKDLIHFEKLPEERQKELVELITKIGEQKNECENLSRS